MTPAVAYRIWRVEETRVGPRLVSPFRESTWLPGKALQAECKNENPNGTLPRPHEQAPDVAAPVEACSCGIYAYHEPVAMVSALRSGHLGGAVLCWGRITIHPEGVRAQFCRPLALCAPQSLVSGSAPALQVRMAVTYGVPLLELSQLALYSSEFGESYKPSDEIPPNWGRLRGSVFERVARWFNV